MGNPDARALVFEIANTVWIGLFLSLLIWLVRHRHRRREDRVWVRVLLLGLTLFFLVRALVNPPWGEFAAWFQDVLLIASVISALLLATSLWWLHPGGEPADPDRRTAHPVDDAEAWVAGALGADARLSVFTALPGSANAGLCVRHVESGRIAALEVRPVASGGHAQSFVAAAGFEGAPSPGTSLVLIGSSPAADTPPADCLFIPAADVATLASDGHAVDSDDDRFRCALADLPERIAALLG